jgi:hypothetical protein
MEMTPPGPSGYVQQHGEPLAEAAFRALTVNLVKGADILPNFHFPVNAPLRRRHGGISL